MGIAEDAERHCGGNVKKREVEAKGKRLEEGTRKIENFDGLK